jgi:hypothetical protein
MTSNELRSNARGRDRGVCEIMAAGVIAKYNRMLGLKMANTTTALLLGGSNGAEDFERRV